MSYSMPRHASTAQNGTALSRMTSLGDLLVADLKTRVETPWNGITYKPTSNISNDSSKTSLCLFIMFKHLLLPSTAKTAIEQIMEDLASHSFFLEWSSSRYEEIRPFKGVQWRYTLSNDNRFASRSVLLNDYVFAARPSGVQERVFHAVIEFDCDSWRYQRALQGIEDRVRYVQPVCERFDIADFWVVPAQRLRIVDRRPNPSVHQVVQRSIMPTFVMPSPITVAKPPTPPIEVEIMPYHATVTCLREILEEERRERTHLEDTVADLQRQNHTMEAQLRQLLQEVANQRQEIARMKTSMRSLEAGEEPPPAKRVKLIDSADHDE